MVSRATSSGAWLADPAVCLIAGSARRDDVETQSTADIPPHNVEPTSANAWSELLGEIMRIANGGGGRLEIRCVPSNSTRDQAVSVFSVPIEPAAGSKPAELKASANVPTPPNLQPVRIVTDPNAPALQPQDVDHLYPWRQKDLVRELNYRLGRRALNSYDIQAVRRQHHLDDRPDFVFNLPGAGRRYSPAVARWIMDQYTRNSDFFQHARAADHEIMKLRRKKPK
ncbi:MAG TPA: hypothetical protein VFW73_11190 [Lacipirellulaceae bacterium]|nr:hypothetical protein [Lacipirellulaceae bacterium]